MGTEQITTEVQEARENLAQIMEMLDGTAHWCANSGYTALSNLCEKWTKICRQAEPNDLAAFRGQCEDLLDDCAAFQTYVYKAGREFANRVENRLPLLEELAGDDEDSKSIGRQITERWNNVEKPQLLSLYIKSEQLEKGIRDMMDSIETN